MPVPTPSPQSPFRSPPTSIPSGEPTVEGPGGFIYPPNQPAFGEGEGESISSPPQPAPGGGVGGFTYPRQGAADHPHPPNYGSADISRSIHEKVWHTYNKVSQEFDEKKLEKWNKDLEALLLFVSLELGGGLCSEMTQNPQAALFSAIVTAFLITSLNDLGPNYQQQSALLLYQSLNGRDPNQASMSDPTAPFQPSSSAIAVNCLWSVSLSASLGASFIAVICKEWLAEYNSSTNIAVDLLQACWRQHRFLILHKLKIHSIISLLPPLLHSSVIFFFAGAVVYFWQIDMRVAAIYLVAGGIFCTTYLISTFLPIVMNTPFHPSLAQLVHKSTVAIGKAVESIADAFAHGCFCALHTVTGAILWLFARTTIAEGALHTLHQQTRTVSLGVSKRTRDWWADASTDSLDETHTSQRAQEEAILWLSQMPLDPSESKDVVSSLALISRPHKFPKSMVMFVYFTLDSWLREDPKQRQPDPAINCIILLGHIKYQSVVDRNLDEDHNVGGVPVTPSVAWAAQWLADGGFDESRGAPHPEEIRARLLTAAAWLSPEYAAEVTVGEEKLRIQDRSGFLKRIEAVLTQRVRGGRPFDNRVLINLIHGMHACIPRKNYGSPSSIIPFLPLFYEEYGSPWSEDESMLKALITYALDLLLSPERRKLLVEREIEFDKLASELIDVLKTDVTATDVVMFGFWLIYSVPYVFTSRKSVLEDIVHLRALTIPDDHRTILAGRRRVSENHRKQINFLAVGAFVAATRGHVAAKGTLPKHAAHSLPNLLGAAPEDGYGRWMATYAVAMILNLSPPSQAATFTREANAGSFANTLDTAKNDLEANAIDEDTLDLQIYSTLVLLKLREHQVGVGRLRELIEEMKGIIGEPVVRDPRTEIDVDVDRVRWKAIYLSGLLFKVLPPEEREEPIEMLQARVRTMLWGGGLSFADDYERCIGPLGMDVDVLEWKNLADRRWLGFPVFEKWVNTFPLLPLVGSTSKLRRSGEH